MKGSKISGDARDKTLSLTSFKDLPDELVIKFLP